MKLPTSILLCAILVEIVNADYYRGFGDIHLVARQTQTCTNSSSCEVCFGPGMVDCRGSHCYKPSAGESCCTGGNYCPAGKTCVNIDGGCCNNGQSLADCAASLGVPIPTSTTAAPTTGSTSGSTTSQGTSDSIDDTITAAQWISDHKAIIGGAAAGVLVLLILLILVCCCACRRRKPRSNPQPPMSATHYQPVDNIHGQYYYPPPQHQSAHY